jgi:hypothetical protein
MTSIPITSLASLGSIDSVDLPVSEVWKVCKNFSRYMVSNLGRVKAINTGRIKKVLISRTGQIQYALINEEGNNAFKNVGVLVAENFIDNPNGYVRVKNLDGDRMNNVAANLTWVSGAEGWIGKDVTNCKAFKLSDEQVLEIKKLYKEKAEEGMTHKKLADLFDVTITTISKIFRGEGRYAKFKE